jgi:hypothetical protein
MNPDIPVATLATTAGAVILVVALIQVIRNLLAFTDAQIKRFGPTLAIALGLVIAIPAALYAGADPGQAVVNGIMAGLAAMGLYDAGSQAVGRVAP